MPCIACHRGKLRRTRMCQDCVAKVAVELKAHYARITFAQPEEIKSNKPQYPEYQGAPAF